ncbi:putative LRR receptor-like serine/threonine-protein kinase [Acorus calamus]|uniref:LRR receptor-like serine/threonine-protein kinase n=1 Tax=Acorus calamus TaxID=4465 RepID=A0AAV9CCG2_ACOCL|nr:putative LRR receptor-like serine/threonine-protein kinase [Acorus calamus]
MLRSFPTGVRNCYDIDISSGSGKGKGGKYLLRAGFFYGNYDGQNSSPEFDLYAGVNLWAAVRKIDNHTVFELIMVAQTNTVSVCLVNKDTGTPYVSAIELRPLGDNLYPAATDNTSLTFQDRYNYAPAVTSEKIRKGEIRGGSFRLDNLEFTDVDVLQMTNNFEKEIGKGGFGTVYMGEKYDGTQVAVKRLKEMSQGSRMFLNEVLSM